MNRKGLTLVEIVIVIALLALISTIYFVAANPAGQLASARNNERKNHLQTIMNAIRQNIADQSNEQFSCSSGPIPTSTTRMASTAGSYNIAPCIVLPNGVYGIFTMPFDPATSSAHYNSNADYDSGYNIMMNSSTGQITLSAPAAELKQTISIIR